MERSVRVQPRAQEVQPTHLCDRHQCRLGRCGDGWRGLRLVAVSTFVLADCRQAVASAAAASVGGPKSAALRGSGPAATAFGVGCSERWEGCLENRCCQSQSDSCYAKNAGYAQCRPSCYAGVHWEEPVEYQSPWSCELLSPFSGPGDDEDEASPPPQHWPEPGQHSWTPTHAPATVPAPAPAARHYSLDWQAKGESFFDGFNFLTSDGNHGSSNFLPSFEAAEKAGVAEASSSRAILRAGPRSSERFKRDSAKIGTKKSWKHFLAVLKYSHVPYGCGLWPAFFTLGVGEVWPMAGEMDILEYVNDQGSMTSFHTGKQCKLDPAEVNKFKPMPDANRYANNGSEYDCRTQYCETCTSLGCAPNVLPLYTGKQWSNRPGALAMQRTERFTKLFYIPEGELPEDLEGGEALDVGEDWDQWLVSYYPFADSSGCPNPDEVMSPQQFILSIAFCGDWASKVWGQSEECSRTGPVHNATATKERQHISKDQHQCRAVDPLAEYAPMEDCCTQFIADEDEEFGTDKYLAESAFFDISWFRVFTA